MSPSRWAPPGVLGPPLVLLLSTLWAGACTPPCEPGRCEPPNCGREVQAYLTRGDAPSERFEASEGIVMVRGPQGGWHLSIGVQVVDPDPFAILDIRVEARGELVVEDHYELALDEHDGCTGQREDLYGFLDVRALETAEATTPPTLLTDETLIVSLEAQTSTGMASDTVELIGVPDPKDVD